MLWPLGPSPWAPMVAIMYHMNTFESLAPEDDSCQVWLKSNHAFLQEVDSEQLLFTYGPLPNLLPHMGAIGATQGSATNNLYSSPKKLSTLYTT